MEELYSILMNMLIKLMRRRAICIGGQRETGAVVVRRKQILQDLAQDRAITFFSTERLLILETRISLNHRIRCTTSHNVPMLSDH